MKHWIWSGYAPGAGYAFAEDEEGLPPGGRQDLLFGRPFREPLPEVRVTALSEGKLPGVMGSVFHALVVADEVRAVLEEHAEGAVQFLAAKLKGRRAAKYWALNVTARVKAMDREKSKFETFPDSDAIREVRRLVLRDIPAKAPALFHLEGMEEVLLVSDALKEALEKASDSPGEFESPDKWRLGLLDDEA